MAEFTRRAQIAESQLSIDDYSTTDAGSNRKKRHRYGRIDFSMSKMQFAKRRSADIIQETHRAVEESTELIRDGYVPPLCRQIRKELCHTMDDIDQARGTNSQTLNR